MADTMDAALGNYGVFMQQYTHDAEVALAWYKKANGIPSPSSSDTDSPWFILILNKVMFWSSKFKVTIYV
jgi:hypothetical protein